MKVFISSVVSGFEAERDAAAEAARTLGCEVRRGEDFTASEASPAQQVCLDGVRWADCVVLVLGERYGAIQPSGKSATHEEYEEARQRGTALAFVQRGITPEERQAGFIAEVQDWQGGIYTDGFSTPAELTAAAIKTLHEFALRQTQGRPAAGELRAAALEMLPRATRGYRPIAHLAVAVFLRPSSSRRCSCRAPLFRTPFASSPSSGRMPCSIPGRAARSRSTITTSASSRSAGPQLTIEQSGAIVLSVDVAPHGDAGGAQRHHPRGADHILGARLSSRRRAPRSRRRAPHPDARAAGRSTRPRSCPDPHAAGTHCQPDSDDHPDGRRAVIDGRMAAGSADAGRAFPARRTRLPPMSRPS